MLLQFNDEWYEKNRLVVWAREKLRQLGITGLNKARYFCRLLERLPTLVQVQYSYETVLTEHYICSNQRLFTFCT